MPSIFAAVCLAGLALPILESATYSALFAGDMAATERLGLAAAKLLSGQTDEKERYGELLTVIGVAQLFQKKYQAAETTWTTELEIQQKLHGAKHPRVALTLYNLGNLYIETSRYDQAEQVFSKSLTMRDSENSTSLVDTFYLLGRTYQESGRLEDAKTCYQKSIDLAGTVRSSELTALDAYRNLTAIYCRLGKPEDAAKELHKARKLDPEVKIDYPAAQIYIASNRPKEAIEILKDLMATARENAKTKPAHLGQLCAALGEAESLAGNKDAAKILLVEAVESTEKAFGPEHLRLATVLETYARLFPKEGKDAAARAAKIREAAKKHAPLGYKAVFVQDR